MDKLTKIRLFKILNKNPYTLTPDETRFLLENITYEVLEEYQQKTGIAILIDGINWESGIYTEDICALKLFFGKYLEI